MVCHDYLCKTIELFGKCSVIGAKFSLGPLLSILWKFSLGTPSSGLKICSKRRIFNSHNLIYFYFGTYLSQLFMTERGSEPSFDFMISIFKGNIS